MQSKFNWFIIAQIIYAVVVILVCLRIIWDTRSTSKALAYLLLVIFLPVIGIFIYFSFGINYRKRKIYSKKLFKDDKMADKLRQRILEYSSDTYNKNMAEVESNRELVFMLTNDSLSTLTSGNNVQLLINGEQKFPEVFSAIASATKHIHIEYYIFEYDGIGKKVIASLIEKAKQGIDVRFIFDDYGSNALKRKTIQMMRNGGIQVFPFYKIKMTAFANRLNYRNHRKIIVVDGETAFVGGINVSDRYINNSENSKKLFWRDTHLRIDGSGVQYLQYLFLCDWNFCAKEDIQPSMEFFPDSFCLKNKGNKMVQIAASGPDSETPTILYSMLQAINLATEEILITTPYFIPSESIIDALIASALGGVKVKLLVPGNSDSVIVNAAAYSYYDVLLKAGADIYLYKKGFVHAKTLVTDRKVAMIGTANMDYRSFDLNFEVNALVYDSEFATQLSSVFYKDIDDAEKIELTEWISRPVAKQLMEKCARLISPML